MKQNLYASTFEIIKATFWPQFWRFGKVDDVYVDLISCCRRWSFNKHWFESFHFVFNSSQVHQCTQYERLLKSFAFAIFHQTSWAHIKNVWFCANYLFFATLFKLSHKMATSSYKILSPIPQATNLIHIKCHQLQIHKVTYEIIIRDVHKKKSVIKVALTLKCHIIVFVGEPWSIYSQLIIFHSQKKKKPGIIC
jgi:hypothetical protein